MDNVLLGVLIAAIGSAIVGPIISWLLTRRVNNSRVRVDEFTAFTNALNSQVAALTQRVADLERSNEEKDGKIADLREENTELRDQIGQIKDTVRRYFRRVQDAWASGSKMPDPDPHDLEWLELTIPTVPPTGPIETKGT